LAILLGHQRLVVAVNHVGTVACFGGDARRIMRDREAIRTERMAEPVLHPLDAPAQCRALESVAQRIVVRGRTNGSFLPNVRAKPSCAVVRDWHDAPARRFRLVGSHNNHALIKFYIPPIQALQLGRPQSAKRADGEGWQ